MIDVLPFQDPFFECLEGLIPTTLDTFKISTIYEHFEEVPEM